MTSHLGVAADGKKAMARNANGFGIWLGKSTALCALVSALALSGCSSLPESAPTSGEVEASSNSAVSGIYIFDLNRSVISALAQSPDKGFAGRFTSQAPAADLRIATGDVLQISVIESSGTLFRRPSDTGGSTGGASPTGLLPVTVERDGTVTVPYAGTVRAAGLTAAELSSDIEHRLADQAVNPQVQVALSPSASVGANSAAVGGEVNKAGVFPLRASGTKLLDLIAEAGGARFPAHEVTVRLTRGKADASVSLDRIIEKPEENIFVYPGDSVYLTHDPKTFSVLGASTKVGRYTFGSPTLNLAEAVAEAGGFVDAVSDPSGVFLFRYEPASFVASLKPGDASVPAKGMVPVIFRLNMREGDGYFRAREFQVHDKDIILLADADGTQLLKVVNLLQGATGTATNVRTMFVPLKSSGGTSTTTTTIQIP